MSSLETTVACAAWATAWAEAARRVLTTPQPQQIRECRWIIAGLLCFGTGAALDTTPVVTGTPGGHLALPVAQWLLQILRMVAIAGLGEFLLGPSRRRWRSQHRWWLAGAPLVTATKVTLAAAAISTPAPASLTRPPDAIIWVVGVLGYLELWVTAVLIRLIAVTRRAAPPWRSGLILALAGITACATSVGWQLAAALTSTLGDDVREPTGVITTLLNIATAMLSLGIGRASWAQHLRTARDRCQVKTLWRLLTGHPYWILTPRLHSAMIAIQDAKLALRAHVPPWVHDYVVELVRDLPGPERELLAHAAELACALDARAAHHTYHRRPRAASTSEAGHHNTPVGVEVQRLAALARALHGDLAVASARRIAHRDRSTSMLISAPVLRCS